MFIIIMHTIFVCANNCKIPLAQTQSEQDQYEGATEAYGRLMV